MMRAFWLTAWLGLACSGVAQSLPTPAPRTSLTELRVWLTVPRPQRPALAGHGWATAPLARAEAEEAGTALWADHAAFIRETRATEMAAGVIDLDGLRMPFALVPFTNIPAPPEGYPLVIVLHGGGQVPHDVNEAQWRNQIRLAQTYRPRAGLYLAPRAPTDTWNLWHQAHVDRFLDRLIENLVVLRGVNPNRIYLLGYSAGGDGAFQLAPRLADRWAAAAALAGHPNDAAPESLRNVPFAIHVGADDRAFNRHTIAADWGARLDVLQRDDPVGYVHHVELHAGKRHWMDLEDRAAVPWMEAHTRDPLPTKIVWRQGAVPRPRGYWLAVPPGETGKRSLIVAEREGQCVMLKGPRSSRITVLLNDAMLDLDLPVRIQTNGSTPFDGRVPRTIATLQRTLAERGDTNLVFSAEVTVTVP
ncbi:MAG: alpha/beta hydrolase [Lentisphaerae bacterium]|nr:alpha/beta hydrolase [Lentisphaerota bacterium]